MITTLKHFDMPTLIESLRELAARDRARRDKGKDIAERVKKVAEAAREVSRELRSGKG